jgi:hypothetical protein
MNSTNSRPETKADDPRKQVTDFVLELCLHVAKKNKNLTRDSRRGFGLAETAEELEIQRKKAAQSLGSTPDYQAIVMTWVGERPKIDDSASMADCMAELSRIDSAQKFIHRPYVLRREYDLASLAPFMFRDRIREIVDICHSINFKSAKLICVHLDTLVRMFEQEFSDGRPEPTIAANMVQKVIEDLLEVRAKLDAENPAQINSLPFINKAAIRIVRFLIAHPTLEPTNPILAAELRMGNTTLSAARKVLIDHNFVTAVSPNRPMQPNWEIINKFRHLFLKIE